jgi:hypothetical protein
MLVLVERVSFTLFVNGTELHPVSIIHQEGLDPAVRARKQAELEELKLKYEEQKVHELERKMAVRYHKVTYQGKRRSRHRQKQQHLHGWPLWQIVHRQNVQQQ